MVPVNLFNPLVSCSNFRRALLYYTNWKTWKYAMACRLKTSHSNSGNGIYPNFWIWYNDRSSQNLFWVGKELYILLMAEILHHPGCMKPCKQRDNLPYQPVQGFLPSTVVLSILVVSRYIAYLIHQKKPQKTKCTNRRGKVKTNPSHPTSQISWLNLLRHFGPWNQN